MDGARHLRAPRPASVPEFRSIMRIRPTRRLTPRPGAARTARRGRLLCAVEPLEERCLLAGVVSVTLDNVGATTATNPTVRFAEVFADADVPAGYALSLNLPDGTPLPYTAARVNT